MEVQGSVVRMTGLKDAASAAGGRGRKNEKCPLIPSHFPIKMKRKHKAGLLGVFQCRCGHWQPSTPLGDLCNALVVFYFFFFFFFG